MKERVAKTESGKWITGRGWIETFWKPPQFPTRTDLDKIAPHNPAFLTRADGHAGVANSAALKIANIDQHTPNPFGGQILKTDGEPNGMLLDNAMDLVAKIFRRRPKPSASKPYSLASTARSNSVGAKFKTPEANYRIRRSSGAPMLLEK
jgi:Predicted metal-dependent hydrolase with the TIM-barrel fold